MRISDWSSDVCSSDLAPRALQREHASCRRPDRGASLHDGRFDHRTAVVYQIWTGACAGCHQLATRALIAWDSSPGASSRPSDVRGPFMVWRSEERRVGTECGSTGIYGVSAVN